MRLFRVGLRDSCSEAVRDNRAPFLQRNPSARPLDAPVQACYRYPENRPGQCDYQRALAAGLPMGSGAVERAHRYVIQQRLKIAGAGWTEENAAKIVQLRVGGANQETGAVSCFSNRKTVTFTCHCSTNTFVSREWRSGLIA